MAAFTIRTFTQPDRLKTIASKRLLALLEPWREFLQAKGFEFDKESEAPPNHEKLTSILIEGSAETPTEMVDALYYIHETASDEDVEALLDMARKRDVEIEHDARTTVCDIAVQVWLANPELLRERHAESYTLRQQNFDYFSGEKGAKGLFPTVSEATFQLIQEGLDNWFEKYRRGRGCRVFVFNRGRKVWILVRHGASMRREASHNDDGTSSTEFYRPQKHDVIIYDNVHDEIGVHCDTKGERILYLKCFGKHLFGNEDYFPCDPKFSLQPLVDSGVHALNCEDIHGIELIRLVEYRKFWGGSQKASETYRANDVFAALAERGREFLAGGKLTAAVFKVKFIDSEKERTVRLRPPCSARYERNEDSEVIEHWLSQRGFILDRENEIDDDPTVALVLQGA